uniref:Uncharacterized protein n=1 Tax=Anguilla anguilla TaxID=7936 RepID=A0A0E9XUY5_ANGAN
MHCFEGIFYPEVSKMLTNLKEMTT